MENELRNLRNAMNSTTHKGIHFTELQKNKIRASLNQSEPAMKSKPKLSIYIITTIAASLFIFLAYPGFFPIQHGANHVSEDDWTVRHEYVKAGKELFSVYPDPYLSANKPFGYLFSFKEGFDVYQGKEIEIVATHHETGKKITVVPAEKITEPSSGYTTLERFTTAFSLPEAGTWKYEIYFDQELYGDVILSVREETFLPASIPSFVLESDFDKIDWNRKADNFGANFIGNEKKSGVIGADMPSVNIDQKWMWHLWGDDEFDPSELTVVGFHRETETVHQLITRGWTIELSGENNGANAHMPSSVNIPIPGEWAILLYVDGELFDVLVYDINE